MSTGWQISPLIIDLVRPLLFFSCAFHYELSGKNTRKDFSGSLIITVIPYDISVAIFSGITTEV